MAGADIGIDLGTANVLVYVDGKGIVLEEPSVVAIEKNTNTVLAVGHEARKMIGRTPANIVAIRPLKDGVISDYEVTEKMLKYFTERVVEKKGFGRLVMPRIMVCVPTGVTEVEKRAVEDATREAGAREVYIIEEPIAAAIGAGMDISLPNGNMVIDIGGGTTEVAVISLGGIVVSNSIRIAGDEIDEAIVNYIKKELDLAIGQTTAEEIKMKIGCAKPLMTKETMEIRGRDLNTGLPRNIEINSEQIEEAMKEPINDIVEIVKMTLEKTPPELSSDVMEKGIILAGGGALIRNLDKLISEKTGIPVIIANNPLNCVVKGCGKTLEDLEKLKTILANSRRNK